MTDDDTVYVKREFYSSGSTGKRFHTDPDCQYVGDSHRERTREYVEKRDGKLCTKCDPTLPDPSKKADQRRSLRQLIAAGEVAVDESRTVAQESGGAT